MVGIGQWVNPQFSSSEYGSVRAATRTMQPHAGPRGRYHGGNVGNVGTQTEWLL